MKMLPALAGLMLCPMLTVSPALAKDKTAAEDIKKHAAGDQKAPCKKPLTPKRAALLNSKGAAALFDSGVKKPEQCDPFFMTRLFVEKALELKSNVKVGVRRPKVFGGDYVSTREGLYLINIVITQSTFPPEKWLEIDPKELEGKLAAPAPKAKKEDPPVRPASPKSPRYAAGDRKHPCKKPLTAKKAALLDFGIAEALFDESVKKAEQCEPFFITRLFIEKQFGPGSSDKIGVNRPKAFNGDYVSKKEGVRLVNLIMTYAFYPPTKKIDVDLKELEK